MYDLYVYDHHHHTFDPSYSDMLSAIVLILYPFPSSSLHLSLPTYVTPLWGTSSIDLHHCNFVRKSNDCFLFHRRIELKRDVVSSIPLDCRKGVDTNTSYRAQNSIYNLDRNVDPVCYFASKKEASDFCLIIRTTVLCKMAALGWSSGSWRRSMSINS